MQKAIELTEAIELVVKARKQTYTVDAIWQKLNRVAVYLNQQLAVELSR